ncbi:MAG: hypothetical protein WAL41_20485, partial [Mycobacterium sp.]
AALAATAGLAFSAVIGTLPPVASAGPAQAFDIWNLSAGPLEVTSAYPPDGPGMPQEGAKIPIGKNLQIPVGTRSYVLIRLLGRKPINQGQRPQAWKINMSTDNPTPTPDIRSVGVHGDLPFLRPLPLVDRFDAQKENNHVSPHIQAYLQILTCRNFRSVVRHSWERGRFVTKYERTGRQIPDIK